MKCRPSELRIEEYEELKLVALVMTEMVKKNPMMIFS